MTKAQIEALPADQRPKAEAMRATARTIRDIDALRRRYALANGKAGKGKARKG